MPRLRAKHLPHTVSISRFVGETAEGESWDTPIEVPAYVEQKTRLVVDRRSPSPTAGQEITSMTRVFVLPDADCIPRSRVTVWAGTLRERTSEVITAAFYDYRGTPNHAQLDLE